MITRRKTRQIKVGDVRIGGGAPISIQSMTKTDTRNVKATVAQIKELENAGCEIIRVAVLDKEAARAIRDIKKKIKIPLVADIHFNYRLALEAIKSGADKIRLNPGNIFKKEEIELIAKAAKKRHIPIRVGVNSGSLLEGGNLNADSRKLPALPTGRHANNRKYNLRKSALDSRVSAFNNIPATMVTSALNYIKTLERFNFRDIVISLKASDVPTTIEAYRLMSKKTNYPLHLGITAAGLVEEAAVKSAVGMGTLLSEGIGDTIRVSIAGEPIEEVRVAKEILSSLNLRQFGPELIVCPTCGRCQIDVVSIAEELKSRLAELPLKSKGKPLKIAVMGCIVNGPGEAKDADIGFAGGKGVGIIFKKGKMIKKVKEEHLVSELLNQLF